MPGRSIYNEPIRHGYHGQEMDSEHKGDGNHYTTYFRQYDPRLGRWMSLDPKSAMFPFESNYAANHNNPIIYVDSEGDSPILVGVLTGMFSEFTMQMIKGIRQAFREAENENNNITYFQAFGQAFGNIDIGDIVIQGIIGGILNPSFTGGEARKRTIKYIGKLVMNSIDFRINVDNVDFRTINILGLNLRIIPMNIDINIELSLTWFGLEGGNAPKPAYQRWRDRGFMAIAILLQEIEFRIEFFYNMPDFFWGWFTQSGIIEGKLKGNNYPIGDDSWARRLANLTEKKMPDLNATPIGFGGKGTVDWDFINIVTNIDIKSNNGGGTGDDSNIILPDVGPHPKWDY